MYYNFNNTLIHYEINGTGKAVVLLHGFLESSIIWEEYARELAKKFKVVLIDLPGHGKSDYFSNSISIDGIAKMVKKLLEHLDIFKTQMLGHSLGGYVTLSFAEMFPDKLESFILFHSTAYADFDEVLKKRTMAVEMLNRHPKLYIKQTIKGLFRAATIGNFETEVDRLIENALKAKPRGYVETVEAMKSRPDRIHVLQSNIPKYFIAGRFDPVISVESSIEQIKHINNGSSMILEQAGHMGFVEEKEAAFQLIAQFLNKVNDIA